MRHCPTCGHETADGHFCVRCGAPLTQSLPRPRRRAQYAAAPHQRPLAPWVVTTLFPQLPRGSERHFRTALVLGAVLVVALGAARLFGVALLTAALLLPAVTLLYFYDADVYRDDPAWPITWTVGWGAVTGVAVGLFARVVGPSGAALLDRSGGAQVAVAGIAVPALGVVAMLSGPLVLLPYRRFNDTLDGATFGGGCAATFAAAEAIVVGAGVLGGGLRPPGAVLPWAERLLALAVATPVLAMGSVGFAAAALWLRYRAPATDRRALGLLGAPPVGIGLALILVVAGAVAETVFPVGLWLAMLVVLDAVALVLLRAAIHVGLLEEAGEQPIGAAIRCLNCRQMTPRHTFCANCGVALRALPHGRDDEQAGRHASEGRLGRAGAGARRWAGGVLVVTVAAVLAATAAVIVAPGPPRARCPRGGQCGAPPSVPRAVTGLLPGYSGWRSPGLGYSLRYLTGQWTVARQSASEVVLQASDGVGQIAVAGAPASAPGEIAELLSDRRSALAASLLGLAPDSAAEHQILGPNLGLVSGVAAVYRATTDLPQAPGTPVSVVLLGARAGAIALVASVISPANDPGEQSVIFSEADDVLNSITYPGT